MSLQSEPGLQPQIDVADGSRDTSQVRQHNCTETSQHRNENTHALRDVRHAFLRDVKRLLALPELKRAFVCYTIASLCLLGAALWFTSLKTVAVLFAIGWLLFP